MSSSQSTPEYYCDESTMAECTENISWPYDHNVPATDYQVSPDQVPIETYFNFENHSTWIPEISNVPAQEQNIPYEINRNLPHHISIQYMPLTPEPVQNQIYYLPSPLQNGNILVNRHHAHISFAPVKKTIVKRKRKRTIFTTEQVQALEAIFKRKQYITREDRQVIVDQLQLNDKSVKIWFQNRRLKDKREPEQEECETEQLLEEKHCLDNARLHSVESRINKNTDEFGFVTLDDSIMGDLINVIDNFLTSQVPTNDSCSTIYEPISPASISDSNDDDDVSSWKPSEPNESLQRLFDLQTMLSL